MHTPVSIQARFQSGEAGVESGQRDHDDDQREHGSQRDHQVGTTRQPAAQPARNVWCAVVPRTHAIRRVFTSAVTIVLSLHGNYVFFLTSMYPVQSLSPTPPSNTRYSPIPTVVKATASGLSAANLRSASAILNTRNQKWQRPSTQAQTFGHVWRVTYSLTISTNATTTTTFPSPSVPGNVSLFPFPGQEGSG